MEGEYLAKIPARQLEARRLRITIDRRWAPMHSIACFFGLVFLVTFALIAIPVLILLAKLVGLALVGGVIALIVLDIWKLFDIAEPQYRPY